MNIVRLIVGLRHLHLVGTLVILCHDSGGQQTFHDIGVEDSTILSIHGVSLSNSDNDLEHHTIYLAIGGNGFAPTLNYDYQWRAGRGRMSSSIGVYFHPFSRDKRYGFNDHAVSSSWSIPIQWNHFFGKRIAFEYGIGVTYSRGFSSHEDLYHEYNDNIYSEAIHLVLKPACFRYHASSSRFFLRAYPLVAYKALELNDDFQAWLDDKYTQPNNGGSAHLSVIILWFGVDLGINF